MIVAFALAMLLLGIVLAIERASRGQGWFTEAFIAAVALVLLARLVWHGPGSIQR